MLSVTVAVLAGGVLNMFFCVLPPKIGVLFFGAPITPGIYSTEPLPLNKSHFQMLNVVWRFVWVCGRDDLREQFLSSC
jgi:hypothetical protein